MGVVWASPSSSQRRQAHTLARDGSTTGIRRPALSPPDAPLRAVSGVISPEGASHRSLAAACQRVLRWLFASLSPEARTAFRGGDALTVARRSRALDALARTNVAVRDGFAHRGSSLP